MIFGNRAAAAWRQAWPLAAQVGLAAFILCIPSLLVGRPFVFYDTEQYFLFGETIAKFAFEAVLGGAALAPAGAVQLAAPQGDSWILTQLTIMAARSPFYGLPAFLVSLLGGLWTVVAAQALLVAGLLRRLVGLAGLRRPGLAFIAICVALTALTSAPFYVTLLMPDVFAAVALLCVGILMLYADRIGRREAVVWWMVLLASLNLHGTHPLIAVTAAGAAALALWRLGASSKSIVMRAGVVLAALVLAAALNIAFQKVVELKLGARPASPPFLTARVLADGPGRRYLATACPQAGYALCAHLGKALNDSQTILWADDPAQGVFLPAKVAERRKLIAEQARFVIGTVRFAPGAELASFASNGVVQLVRFGVSNEFYAPLRDLAFDRYWSNTPLAKQIPNLQKCRTDFRVCEHPRRWAAVDRVQTVCVVAALLALAIMLSRQVRRATPVATPGSPGNTERLAAFALVVIATILVNAAICGGLSLPADRYQARIIWLAPLFAALLAWPKLGRA